MEASTSAVPLPLPPPLSSLSSSPLPSSSSPPQAQQQQQAQHPSSSRPTSFHPRTPSPSPSLSRTPAPLSSSTPLAGPSTRPFSLPLPHSTPLLHAPHPPSPLSHSLVNPIDELYAPITDRKQPQRELEKQPAAAAEEDRADGASRRSRSPERVPNRPGSGSGSQQQQPRRTSTNGSRTRRASPRHSIDQRSPSLSSPSVPPPPPLPALPSGAQPPDPHPRVAQELYAPVIPPTTGVPTQLLPAYHPTGQPETRELREMLGPALALRPSVPALRRPPSQSLILNPLPLNTFPPPLNPSSAVAPIGAAYVPPPPIVQPEGEICLECLMRDREMADVDVTSPGVWARASDVWYEELVRREQEEAELAAAADSAEAGLSDEGPSSSVEGKIAGPGTGSGSHPSSAYAHQQPGRERLRAKGQLLTEGNLKVWQKMNPKEPASRWHALQSYVRAQRLLAEAELAARREAEREARLLDMRVKNEFSQVLREDRRAETVASPALNGTWGVRVRLVGAGVGGEGGKEGVSLWGTKRRRAATAGVPGREDAASARDIMAGPGLGGEKHQAREVTLLQNGLVVEHVDLRKAREAEERELAREERALERERRRRTLSNRISFTGLGLGSPRIGNAVGKGERASSYSYSYPSQGGPAAVGGAELEGYATTPWRASASASQPTLLPPSSPGVSYSAQHPYGYPFPPSRPYAQQSPSSSSRRLSSPLSSPNPHLSAAQPHPPQHQQPANPNRRESPRSSAEVNPPTPTAMGGSGVGLGFGGFGGFGRRVWAHQPNGSDWSLGVTSGVGSGAASMVDMHLGLDMEKQALAQAQAQAMSLGLAAAPAGMDMAAGAGYAVGQGRPMSMRTSPEPVSPRSYVFVDGEAARQQRASTPADAGSMRQGVAAAAADTMSLATSGTATTKKKKGLGGIWKKIRATASAAGRGKEWEDGSLYAAPMPANVADPEKRTSIPVEDQNAHEDLPPLAPPPPLSYLVNRRSAERSPSLSRPSSISSPSCSSPRSLSFSNPALPILSTSTGTASGAESYGSPGTAPTSVSVSLSLDPAHSGPGGGGGAGSGNSRIPSPTQSVRKVSLDMKLPPPMGSPIMESPTLEPGLTADAAGNTPSPSNTVVHNSSQAAQARAQTPQGNGTTANPKTLSLYKSLPPIPGTEAQQQQQQQRPHPQAVQSDPAPAPTYSPPQASFMQPDHARRSSFGGNPSANWQAMQGQQHASPLVPHQPAMQHAYPEDFPDHARSRRSLAPSVRQQTTPDHASEKNRSPKSPSRPKFNFAAFLRRKSFVRTPEPVEDQPEYFVPEPNGYPSFEPPRLPFTPAANYASDMSQSQSSLSSHRPPSSIVGSINRTSVLSAKIPQADDFVAYRYPSLEQPVELFRR